MFTTPMLTRSTCCTFLLALLALLPLLRAPASRAQAPAQASSPSPAAAPAATSGADDDKDRIYTLPTYTVTANRIVPPPEQWRYAFENGFEILSNASDSTTQNLYKTIGEYINVLGSISPYMKPKTNLPIKIIICGQRGFFSQFSDNLTTPVLSTQDGGQILFLINTSGDFMISLTSSDMNADDDAAYITQRFFRQYIDLRMAHVTPPMPPWFQQAMRLLYANMHFNGNNVTFAEIRDNNGGFNEYAASDILSELSTPSDAAKKANVTDNGDNTGAGDSFVDNAGVASSGGDISPFTSDNGMGGDDAGSTDPSTQFPGASTQQRPESGQIIMPMAKFLAYDPNKPDDTTDGKPMNTRTWSRQCVMFVHYCLYSRVYAKKFTIPFMKFLEACSAGPTDEALFKQLFKESYKNMEMDLSNYREYTDSQTQLYKFKEDTRPAPLKLDDATPAQIGRMKGEAKIMLGKTDEGYNDMLTVYMKKKADPALYAALGLYEFKAGNTAKARSLLENAVADKASRPDAYRVLSQLRHDEIMAGKPSDYKLTNDQLLSIITPLLAVRSIPPPDIQTYIMLGEAYRDAERPATETEAAALLEGYNRYPTNPELTLLTAQTMMRGKYYIPARPIVQRALNQPGQSDAWRLWLQQAADELAKLPPETFAPPASATAQTVQTSTTAQPASSSQTKHSKTSTRGARKPNSQ